MSSAPLPLPRGPCPPIRRQAPLLESRLPPVLALIAVVGAGVLFISSLVAKEARGGQVYGVLRSAISQPQSALQGGYRVPQRA
jgi:hypothetical protein